MISKRPKDLLAYVYFSACAKWQFFGDRRFILPCQDEYLKTRRKFTFGTSRHRMTTWSYKFCSPSWHARTTMIVHNPLVFTDESKPTCAYIMYMYLGLKVKENDSRKKMIWWFKVCSMCTRKLALGCLVGSRIGVPCAIRVLEVLKVFSYRFEDAESNERGLTSGKCGELSLEGVFQNGGQNTSNRHYRA